MSNELIYRDAAIAAAIAWNVKPDAEIFNGIKTAIKNQIEQVPTVKSAEREYGQWVYDPNGMDWNLGAYVCSLCRCRNDNIPHNPEMARNPYNWAGSRFCPNCGAQMGPGQDNA